MKLWDSENLIPFGLGLMLICLGIGGCEYLCESGRAKVIAAQQQTQTNIIWQTK